MEREIGEGVEREIGEGVERGGGKDREIGEGVRSRKVVQKISSILQL